METPTIDIVRAVAALPALRAADDADDGEGTLVGHFSVFNTWYEIDSYFEGRFLERVAPGAFAQTMVEDRDQVKVTFNHGYDVLGDQILGPIDELREDKTGAYYEVPLFRGVPDLVVDGLRAGVYGSSFRFRVTADEWDDEPDESDDNPKGWPQRTITKVRLFEFGPVTFPANPDATASARSLTDEFYERMAERNPTKFEAAARAAKVTTGRPGTRSAGGGGADTTAEPAVSPQPPQPAQPKPKAAPARKKVTDVAEETPTTFTLTVEERLARQTEIRARLDEIDNEFNGAELPAETQEEWDNLDVEFEDHERAVKAAQARKDRLARLAKSDGNTERSTEALARGFEHKRTGPEDIYDLAELRKHARSVEDLGSLARDNALRAVEQARYPGVRNREDAQGQVETLLHGVDDELGTLARRILVSGSPVYQRAFGKAVLSRSVAGLTTEEQRAMSLGSDPAGGFAVPFDLDPTVILTSDGSINPLRQVARVEQIVGKEWQGITSAGITVTRSPEAQEATDNSPTLAQPTVEAKRVLGFVPFSVEIDQDWARLRAEMTRLLADAKEQEEADAFVNGDGTGDNPGGIIATLGAGSQVAAAAVGALTIPDDLHAVEEALGPRFRARASWLANKSIYNLVRSTALDAGLTAEDVWVRISSGQPPELIGYPARELSTMTTIAASGGGDNLVLLFGDYMTGFLIVDRVGMSVELVPHLFGATNRFPTGQRGIVAMWRNSSVVLFDNAFRVLNVTSNV